MYAHGPFNDLREQVRVSVDGQMCGHEATMQKIVSRCPSSLVVASFCDQDATSFPFPAFDDGFHNRWA